MNNKIIFITGATSGFGKAIAFKFAEHGWNIIITGRRVELLKKTEDEIKNQFDVNVLYLPFDVRSNKKVQEAVSNLPHDWKKINVLVNNAGLASGFSLIQEGDIEDWEKMIDTNLKGLLYVSRAIMPLMIENKSGHIINMASVAGKEAYLKGNVYCATKFAVDALSKSMRIDLLQHGIKVTNVAPGLAETEFSIVRFHGDAERAKKTYQGLTPLSAADIADIVFFAATRPPHVVINDIVITPLAQANTTYVVKDGDKKP